MVSIQILDNSFLFVLSLVSAVILFAAAIGVNSGLLGLAEASPALLAGVVLPFIVGYMRVGFVKGRSDIERVRGWELFIVGNFAIIGILVSGVLRSLGVLSVASSIVEVLMVLVGISIAWYVTKKLAESLEIDLTYEEKLALVGSSAVGIIFAVVATLFDAVFELFPFVVNEHVSGLLLLELLLLYTSIFYSLLVVGIERACESLLSGSPVASVKLSSFQKWFNKALEKSLLGYTILFIEKATYFLKHERIMIVLVIVSVAFIDFGLLELNNIGVYSVVVLFVGANIALGIAFWRYLRIKNSNLFL